MMVKPYSRQVGVFDYRAVEDLLLAPSGPRTKQRRVGPILRVRLLPSITYGEREKGVFRDSGVIDRSRRQA